MLLYIMNILIYDHIQSCQNHKWNTIRYFTSIDWCRPLLLRSSARGESGDIQTPNWLTRYQSIHIDSVESCENLLFAPSNREIKITWYNYLVIHIPLTFLRLKCLNHSVTFRRYSHNFFFFFEGRNRCFIIRNLVKTIARKDVRTRKRPQ